MDGADRVAGLRPVRNKRQSHNTRFWLKRLGSPAPILTDQVPEPHRKKKINPANPFAPIQAAPGSQLCYSCSWGD